MKTNTNFWRLFRRSTAAGLVLLLVLVSAPVAEAGFWVKRDWSRVQRVAPGTKTTVLLYKDQASRGKRKIKGRFHSATAESVTLTLGRGQTRTLRKQAVLKVLVHRPLKKRYQGWITAGVGAAIGIPGVAHPGNDLNAMGKLLVPLVFIVAPTVIAFLAAPKMGDIYYVPPDRRDPSSRGTKPPQNRSSAAVSGVTEAAGGSTGSREEDSFLVEKSSPDRLRQQARQALIRKGLPLDFPDLTVRGVSAERSGVQTAFDGSFPQANEVSRRARLD